MTAVLFHIVASLFSRLSKWLCRSPLRDRHEHPIGLDELTLVSQPVGWMGNHPPGWQAKQEFGGCSSAGRAPDLHSGGRRFDPDQLHQQLAAGSIEAEGL